MTFECQQMYPELWSLLGDKTHAVWLRLSWEPGSARPRAALRLLALVSGTARASRGTAARHITTRESRLHAWDFVMLFLETGLLGLSLLLMAITSCSPHFVAAVY